MSPAMDNTIFTIGHSNHEWARLVSLLLAHGATAVQDSLKAVGVAYVFLGRELGGRPEDPNCYVEGKVQYRKLAETILFKKGLERVVKGARSHRIALLCAEAEPLVCHRTILVAQELAISGISVG